MLLRDQKVPAWSSPSWSEKTTKGPARRTCRGGPKESGRHHSGFLDPRAACLHTCYSRKVLVRKQGLAHPIDEDVNWSVSSLAAINPPGEFDGR